MRHPLTPLFNSRRDYGFLARELDDLISRFEPARSFAPAFDIVEQDDRYVLSLDVPGVRKEDLKIELNGSMLTISGSRKSADNNSESWTFERSFTMPKSVAGDGVQAQHEHGVLTLTLPKIPSEQPRLIEIRDSSKSV